MRQEGYKISGGKEVGGDRGKGIECEGREGGERVGIRDDVNIPGFLGGNNEESHRRKWRCLEIGMEERRRVLGEVE